MSVSIDHLVVHAASLAQGVEWCERALGVTPGPGGEHLLFGTHNRLFSIGNGAYFEIIAVNPQAAPITRKRWFDMDESARKEQTAREPRLVHFAVNVPDIAAALNACPYDMGSAVAATRGDFHWQISVRDDGKLHEQGLVPTLIQWGSIHPTQRMPASGIELRELCFEHPQVAHLREAHEALGLRTSDITLSYVQAEKISMIAVLQSENGQRIELRSYDL